MTTDDLIESYSDLLIMQYSALFNARATVQAYVKKIVQDQIYTQVRDGFAIAVEPIGLQSDSAAGKQLEAVASYRGATRDIYGLNVARAYFRMPFYDDDTANAAPGFSLYGESPIMTLWLTYADINRPLYALTDNELYRLTQFRARTNSMLLSIKTIDDLCFEFMGVNVGVFETTDMAITYIDLVSDPDTLFSVLAATNSLPRPAGVKMIVLRSETLTGFFGFQLYSAALNPDFVGFGLYGSPQVGSFVRYG